jgi:non-catalytic primase subunit PriX-like protein
MGNLKDKVVGGKNSYSNFENNLSVIEETFAVRKITPYYYLKEITENTIFILNHFQEPLFPRTISTFRTKGKQIIVYNLTQIINEFSKSDFIDCRINAFSSVKPIPNFIFIDLDNNSSIKIDKVLDKTLKNIKEKLNSNPTVSWTGNGYHIYQPIESLRLEDLADFNFVDSPSNKFLRFAKSFLSNGFADKCNNPSLKSCLIRVPSSFNSKYLLKRRSPKESQVKIIQKWNESRPSMFNLIGTFYSYLISNKLEEQKKAKSLNNLKYNYQKNKDNKIRWIEKLLKIPLKDHRKYCLWRIFIPYLANIQKSDECEINEVLQIWLKECNNVRKLDFDPIYTIKNNLRSVRNFKPISIEKLKEENSYLYLLIKDKRPLLK